MTSGPAGRMLSASFSLPAAAWRRPAGLHVDAGPAASRPSRPSRAHLRHRGPGRAGHRAVRQSAPAACRSRARRGRKPRGRLPRRRRASAWLRRRHRAEPDFDLPDDAGPGTPPAARSALLNQAVSISILNYARPAAAAQQARQAFDWTLGPGVADAARGHRRGLRVVHLRPRQLHQRRARGDARDRLPAARRRHRRRRAGRPGLAGRPAHRPGRLAQPAARPDRRPARRRRRARNRRRPAARGCGDERGALAGAPVAAGRLLAIAPPAAPRSADRDNAARHAPVAGTDEAELWYAMDARRSELAQLAACACAIRRSTPTSATSRARSSAGYCKDLRVYIMNVPGFNASMAPNGMMMVWTGALLRMRDEAELAVRARPRSRPFPRAAHAAAMAPHEGH